MSSAWEFEYSYYLFAGLCMEITRRKYTLIISEGLRVNLGRPPNIGSIDWGIIKNHTQCHVMP